MSELDEALRKFEAAEANLAKLENLGNLLKENLRNGIAFADDAVYEDACRSYEQILIALPLIDGWKPKTLPCDLDEISQSRRDTSKEALIEKLGRELRRYRFRFDQKRRKLIQDISFKNFDEIDRLLEQLQKKFPIDEANIEYGKKIKDQAWLTLCDKVKQVDVLLGSSVPRPPGWSDMQRHLRYGQIQDLRDIVYSDWPSVKEGLTASLYASNEPIPVGVDDLGELVASHPSGSVVTKLNWEKLSAEDFERLIYNLIVLETNYENPQWLTHSNAPDRGRDLSVDRVYQDRLSGVTRLRMIIQCKHWLKKSISINEISSLKEQIKLWQPPRVDIVVIATTGRFTQDAVQYIEQHNQSDSALRLEMWADSHLEAILASNPALIAQFCLR